MNNDLHTTLFLANDRQLNSLHLIRSNNRFDKRLALSVCAEHFKKSELAEDTFLRLNGGKQGN